MNPPVATEAAAAPPTLLEMVALYTNIGGAARFLASSREGAATIVKQFYPFLEQDGTNMHIPKMDA